MKRTTEGMEQLREEYNSVRAPGDGMKQVIRRMDEAEEIKMKKSRVIKCKAAGLAAAAAAAVIVILPNTSASVAYAMEKIPVLGSVVKVVTFRDYQYEDENHAAKVEIPEIVSGGTDSQAVEQVNESVKNYMETAIAQFEKETAENAQGHQGLDISYETVTDNNDWFVLKVTSVETKASGYETAKYYTIDKNSDSIVSLTDLFSEGADYVSAINEAVKAQMREQMKRDENKIFFLDSTDMPENDFTSISEDQNFYIDAGGRLVIAFDEYEVAPGYMGRQEFVITEEAVTGLMK